MWRGSNLNDKHQNVWVLWNKFNFNCFPKIYDISDSNETQTPRVRTSATRTTRVRYECYTNDASATRVKKFDFDSGTSKNIFLQLYIYYMASERPQGEEQFL